MTINEIAKRAGVSIGTVDRVVHGRGHVSEDKERRIREIIESEGYQPNPIARHLKRNERFAVGVLLPELEKESRYWDLIWSSTREALMGLSAFSFTAELFSYERTNRVSLEAAFSRMADANCQAWIIAPVMQADIERLLAARADKPPVCFVDTALRGLAAAREAGSPAESAGFTPLATVAQDPRKGGRVAARLMEMLAPSGGAYAVVRPYTGAWNLNERADAFAGRFAGRSDVRVLDLVCPETDPAEPARTLEAALAGNPDLSGIFTVTAFGHRVAAWLDARFAPGSANAPARSRPVLIGYDLVAENVRRLREGSIDCIISQRPEEQGRLIVHQLYRAFVLREPPEREIRMPIDIFFKENLDE